ncbi:MAG: acylphosphatase [Desulfobacterales bacterium]|jgi:acylphosphatase|nr:acylphosphatase [Desulfobacterales bacterium]
MPTKTVRALINGRVQGVCFRMETERAAEKFGVSGWVRNRRDGSVEALFQGDARAVDDMLKWCGDGPPLAIVTKVETAEAPFQEGLINFIIRHTV